MSSPKQDMWKVGTVIASLLLLIFIVWIPASPVHAHEVSQFATFGTVIVKGLITTTPTIDSETANEQLIKIQRDNDRSFNAWLWNNGAPLISALALTLAAILAIIRYFGDRSAERDRREEEQDRWLKNQEEERKKRAEESFRKVVTDLGSERKEARIAAATLLFTFLQPDYEQFYRQIFDLSVTYLQSFGVDATTTEIVSLNSLHQVLINVFKQAFLRVRGEWREQRPHSLESDLDDHDRLGAVGMQLDEAYLVKADLRGVWLREASLRKAHLWGAKFTGAHLKGANFTDAYLEKALLTNTDSTRAKFIRAKLMKADFTGAYISMADFTDANLTDVQLEAADSLQGAKLCRVIGLKKEQLEACKAKGAIIDEDLTSNSLQSTISTYQPSQSDNAQA